MELYGKNDSFMTYEAAGSCSKCHYILPPLVECAPVYFERGHFTCGHCGEQVDLWEVVSTRAATLRLPPLGLASMGAVQTWIRMSMETGKYYEVNLTDYGALPDAKILAVSYSSQGGLAGSVMPLEWHGNTPARRIRGTILRMIAVPLGEGPMPRVGNVAVSVVWIRGGESDAWPYLVSAFEAAAAGDYEPSLVFAQSAVEISMMPVIASRFRVHSSGENVKRFMVDSLSYGHALNVVLPYLCAELGAPKMPDTIRGALNKLRRTRNLIIHEGVEAAAVSLEDTMEGLSAAAFGFEYMRHVQPILSVFPASGASANGSAR
jgi:hypothetical protein